MAWELQVEEEKLETITFERQTQLDPLFYFG
ncbi:protein G7c [Corchorus olitorius]|uniref:Protein G7c n=1 Tax=Corchorus olitorius TaxID=93759 RepID=A0A1R3KCE5_9ROSI|nr:protein G7c [Corchorus olitorius]